MKFTNHNLMESNKDLNIISGVWETVAPASPARLHSNALDTFRSSCSHHY